MTSTEVKSLVGAEPREIADAIIEVLDSKSARDIKLLRVNDKTVTPKVSASSNGDYYLTVEHIQSYLLDVSHTFEISGGTTTYSRSYAPLNYAYNMQQDDGDLGNLVRALYQYFLKSSAYRQSASH